jgi:hypothetical protein
MQRRRAVTKPAEEKTEKPIAMQSEAGGLPGLRLGWYESTHIKYHVKAQADG